MKPPVILIMPMAGRGSRFADAGQLTPKPLIPLHGKPFFWWAIESVRRCFDIKSLICVVLREHITQHAIDRKIHAYFPQAEIIAIDEVTKGALATALYAVKQVDDNTPVLINDCDHVFDAGIFADAIASHKNNLPEGFLAHFLSSSPHYSYALYDEQGNALRTAEKDPISDRAIAGAYWFRDAGVIRAHAASYQQSCGDRECYISGLYNAIIAAGGKVRGAVLATHIPFGTPEEYTMAQASIAQLAGWENDHG